LCCEAISFVQDEIQICETKDAVENYGWLTKIGNGNAEVSSKELTAASNGLVSVVGQGGTDHLRH
jgi:hypothetical protein